MTRADLTAKWNRILDTNRYAMEIASTDYAMIKAMNRVHQAEQALAHLAHGE